MKSVNKKNNLIFIGALIVISFLIFVLYYNGQTDCYNTTILALNYTYGFISRGFIGSVYLFVDKILPISMVNPTAAKYFLLECTAVLFIIMYIMIFCFYKKSEGKQQRIIGYFSVALTICVVSTFAGEFNFGRVDMYMISISLIGLLLLYFEKAEWLIIPLSAIAVMIHQGYVMMYFNILLVVLLVKILSYQDKKKRIYYIVIFALSFVICSVLFLYLELFSHAPNGEVIYGDVANYASALSYDGEYHKTLLAHEILGVDLSEVEHEFHMKNLCEIILFAILMIPYIVYLIKFFIRLFKVSKKTLDKIKYVIVMIGPGTMLPDFLIKVDYGRWVLSVVVYYLVLFMYMTLKDECFKIELTEYVTEIRNKNYLWKLLLVYPIVMVPLLDVNINGITAIIGHVLNREWLHWWTF